MLANPLLPKKCLALTMGYLLSFCLLEQPQSTLSLKALLAPAARRYLVLGRSTLNASSAGSDHCLLGFGVSLTLPFSREPQASAFVLGCCLHFWRWAEAGHQENLGTYCMVCCLTGKVPEENPGPASSVTDKNHGTSLVRCWALAAKPGNMSSVLHPTRWKKNCPLTSTHVR